MKKDLLGVKIDDVNVDQALEIIKGWVGNRGAAPPAERGEKYYITTPNPELVIMAQTNQQLKNIINKSDLAIPDGIGLKLSGDIVCHTPGIDLMEGLIKLAADKGYTTGFLGGKDLVAKKTSECLLRKYPKLKVTFASDGGEVNNEGNILRGEFTSREVSSRPPTATSNNNVPKTDLLFVAFGQPKQEIWIAKNLDKIPVKIAMGVGGSFDYISGSVLRAPVWIRNIGAEWLFRLILQPWRVKRQFALIKFVLLLLKRSFSRKTTIAV